jgi:biotin synthase-related radical SAM superfamily protein
MEEFGRMMEAVGRFTLVNEAFYMQRPSNQPAPRSEGLSERRLCELAVLPIKDMKESTYKLADCPICFKPYEDEEQVRVLDCEHYYHQECVDAWLLKKNECPICKKKARSLSR